MDFLGKVIQSNARLVLRERLEVDLDHARMPVGNGRMAEKTKGRPVDVLSVINKSTVFMTPAFFCLARALITAMARGNDDPKYKSCSNRYGLK